MNQFTTTPEINTALRNESDGVTSNVRYRMLSLAVLLAAITYLDRVCISLTASAMMRDLSLSKVEMSLVFSAFTLAYAIFEIPTGWWGDRIGARKVLTRIVVWWSGFTIATATAFNYSSLLLIRFLFGAGEAGAWPNAARVFSRWFPVAERGTAQGIFFMGAHLAGGLTPILVTAMLKVMRWRAVFVIFGAVGFVWATAWRWWFRDEPEEHKAVTRRELEHIQRGRGETASHHLDAATWKRILANRSLIALCAAYFTQSYGFYFFITWLPTYLENARGFTSTKLGLLAGLPLLMSVLAIAGGRAGVISACMNTAGQIGGFLSPIVTALFVERYGSWSAPLYLCGILYFLGALCWRLIDPRKPISV